MNYLYLIPFGIFFLIGFFYFLTSEMAEKKMIDKPFLNELSNELYVLSYSAPFKWFINENESDKKVKDIKKLIIEANETSRLNYRVFVVIQNLALLFAIVGFLLFSTIANHSPTIVKVLFNIQMNIEDPSSITNVKVMVGMALLLLCIVPSSYLKKKAKRNNFYFVKDLPILQLFIILMLKAKRPLMEVIFVLSTTNTIYKPIFETTYRICVRDKAEGMKYLMEAFEGTKFEETVKVLSEYGAYSKKQTMTVLENGLKEINEYTTTLKRRKDIGGNLVSQVSLFVPMLGAMLLIFSPWAFYGLNLLNF